MNLKKIKFKSIFSVIKNAKIYEVVIFCRISMTIGRRQNLQFAQGNGNRKTIFMSKATI